MGLIIKIAEHTTVTELKVFIHLFIVPFAILVISTNMVLVFVWIGFLTIIYSTVKKGTESAFLFFEMFKVIAILLLLLFAILLGFFL